MQVPTQKFKLCIIKKIKIYIDQIIYLYIIRIYIFMRGYDRRLAAMQLGPAVCVRVL